MPSYTLLDSLSDVCICSFLCVCWCVCCGAGVVYAGAYDVGGPPAIGAVNLTASVPSIHAFYGECGNLLTDSDIRDLGALVTVGSDQHQELDLLKQFLRFRVADQLSEADTHSRNDALLEVISRASGMEKRARDVQAASTIRRKRPDAHSGFSHCAPFAFEEEKPRDPDIDQAERDLRVKYRWLPHYPAGTIVFGIAIAGDVFRFGHFSQSNPPGFTRLGQWNTKSMAGIARLATRGSTLCQPCLWCGHGLRLSVCVCLCMCALRAAASGRLRSM